MKSISAILILLLISQPVFAAVENLDEAIARKTRMATATYTAATLEKSASNYIWNTEALNYTDTATSNEVWQLTSSPIYYNTTRDISITHWSANGNRLIFQTKRPTASFNTYGDIMWMLVNTDGAKLKPAKGAAAQCADKDPYPLWSPILPDVLYSGNSTDGAATVSKGFYKTTVSDTTNSYSLFMNVSSSTRISTKKAISGDGRKVMITDVTNAKFQPATVYPEASKAFDTTSGYNNQLAFDYYWGKAPTSWNSYHDQYMAGAINGVDGIWNYIMPENASGPWWRARLTGTGTDQSPVIATDHTPPYVWGGELEPANSPSDGVNPWCPQGVVSGTDCMEYFSHFTPDRWGHYGIFSKGTNAPYGTSIADLRDHKYKVTGFTPIEIGGSAAQWVQHHDWEAWSDWSTSSVMQNSSNHVVDALVTQNVNSSTSQRMIADPHVRLNTGGASSGTYESLARPTQSPDGTKVLFNSTFLNASDNYPQLFWTVAYYPYPPEIKSAAKVSTNVRLTWDFNQGTSCSSDAGTVDRTPATPNYSTPRTYATRGWPHETEDCPPSPREIKQFRVWTSPDNTTWTPRGTATYNNCNGTNECGMWAESAWTYDYAQANSSTLYYAVTSAEHSGLESRTLSNTWKVITDGSGNITSQAQQSAYPTNPGGKVAFYTTAPSEPADPIYTYKKAPANADGQYTIEWTAPANKTLIRHYNIYAKDGSEPSINQQSRIASVPATAADTSFSYIDWLGNPDGSTEYIVTAVDYFGNESEAEEPEIGDVTAPVTSLSSTTRLSSKATITLTASEAATTYRCTDSTNTCTPSTGTTATVYPGQWLRYYSVDSASNAESTKSAYFGWPLKCN